MVRATRSEGWAWQVVDWLRPRPGGHLRRFGSFAVIGLVSTVAFVVLYAAARSLAAPLLANFVALSLTMLFNFTANRNYTFRASHGGWATQGVRYLVAYVLGLGASSGVLYLTLELVSGPSRSLETMIAVAAGGVATIIRFVLLSAWVFRTPTVNAPEAAA